MIWIIVVAIVGIVFCIALVMIISSYKRLNSAKFKIITLIETRLPLKAYKAEDNYLKSTKHSPLSIIECVVPAIIIVLYIALATGALLISLELINLPFIPSKA
ncbi:MAG: hypothetical protein WBX01_14185 [Nitrososphaeraceae archaeon]